MKSAVQAATLLADAQARARERNRPVVVLLRTRSSFRPILDPSDLPNLTDLMRTEVRLEVDPDGRVFGPCGEVTRRWVEGMLELLDR